MAKLTTEERAIMSRLPDPRAPGGPKSGTVSVGDLMRMCNIQAGRTKSKRTRLLVLNCGYALAQLVERIGQLEDEKRKVN